MILYQDGVLPLVLQAGLTDERTGIKGPEFTVRASGRRSVLRKIDCLRFLFKSRTFNDFFGIRTHSFDLLVHRT